MDKGFKPFPPFSLTRLLQTVFQPQPNERIGLLIDLPDPRAMQGFDYLNDRSLTVQRYAHDVFFQGLKQGGLAELKLAGGEIFAFQVTGGSNLDLPDSAVDPAGIELSLEQDVYPHYHILLCISTYSATAPLTALAKRHGFRGATLHGLNEIILKTGLAVDYRGVSEQAEKLRLALTGADRFQIEFAVGDDWMSLELECAGQEAQKSHGLCPPGLSDVANLPAGEVYFVPRGGTGEFPLRYADGTLGRLQVQSGRVNRSTLLRGDQAVIDAHNAKLESDPMTGVLGELGFGTQELPPSGSDIQDEKILGTLHVATGRSDHLGGDLAPGRFANASNATHDDLLFSPSKTPEIRMPQVIMRRGGKTVVVLEDYQPAAYLKGALAS